MNRILLGIALACTTPACMHLESAPQRGAVKARTVQAERGVPRRSRAAFEAPPVASAEGGDLPLRIAAGAAIALGVFLYVD